MPVGTAMAARSGESYFQRRIELFTFGYDEDGMGPAGLAVLVLHMNGAGR